MTEALPIDDGRCFGCGPYSADGLHMRFETTGEGAVRSQVVLPPRFQGWRGTAHGGVVMMMLDEAMAYACGALGERAMTASMQVRFRAAVPLGAPLTVSGTVKWKRRAVIAVEAAVTDAAGAVLATAEGSFIARGPLGTQRLGAPRADVS